MHSNRRMLEWGGFPGDTEHCRIAWKGWKVMNDWNVRNVWMPLEGLAAECLECPVEHMDGFLEDLLAFYV